MQQLGSRPGARPARGVGRLAAGGALPPPQAPIPCPVVGPCSLRAAAPGSADSDVEAGMGTSCDPCRTCIPSCPLWLWGPQCSQISKPLSFSSPQSCPLRGRPLGFCSQFWGGGWGDHSLGLPRPIAVLKWKVLHPRAPEPGGGWAPGGGPTLEPGDGLQLLDLLVQFHLAPRFHGGPRHPCTPCAGPARQSHTRDCPRNLAPL